jgi:hypothetical protein
MDPTIIMKLPDQNHFVGSSDAPSWKTWWISHELDGNVEKIISEAWVYGRYHVALVKMIGGSYNIYRSSDSGRNWYSVYSTSNVVYYLSSMYGTAILFTSNGVYASIDSGRSFSKIADDVIPAKNIYSCQGGQIIYVHTGSAVHRSYNYGRTWHKIIDKAGWLSVSDLYGERLFSWTGDSYPALAGFADTILIGFGPYLVMSSDEGETFVTHPSAWSSETDWGFQFSPDSNSRIIQLILTGVYGSSPSDCTWMARVWLKSSNVVRHLFTPTHPINDETNVRKYWHPKFDQPFTSADEGHLTAYEILRVGTDIWDRLVFSAQSRYSTQKGEFEPSLKYSIDGGEHFIDLQVESVLTPEGFVIPGTAVTDSYKVRRVWYGPPCHNWGWWEYIIESWVRHLSYDLGVLIKDTRMAQFPSNVDIKKEFENELQLNALLQKTFEHPSVFDMWLQKEFETELNMNPLISKEFENPFESSMISIIRRTYFTTSDALLQKEMVHDITFRVPIRGPMTQSVSLDVILVKTTFDEIYRRVEKYLPQDFAIKPKPYPGAVWDSRKDGEP